MAGGARSGEAGSVYANRSDLSGDSSGDRAYGDGVNKAAVVAATPSTRPPAAQAPPPGSLGSLHAPSERPTEPVTTGLSLGAGAGPEAVGQQGYTKHDPALWELRALAQFFPDHPDLLNLIARAEARQ